MGKLAYKTLEIIKEIEKVMSENRAATREGVQVIKATTSIIRNMIENMEKSSEKINLLQNSIMVEEQHINIIDEQLSKNIVLSKTISTSTSEQMLAIASNNRIFEQANEIVVQLVHGIQEISSASAGMQKDSEELIKEAESIRNLDNRESTHQEEGIE